MNWNIDTAEPQIWLDKAKENLIKFHAPRPIRPWVGDITFIN